MAARSTHVILHNKTPLISREARAAWITVNGRILGFHPMPSRQTRPQNGGRNRMVSLLGPRDRCDTPSRQRGSHGF
jgi:hypothetical protein